ncbi:MAG: DNA polymerase III subunit beta [Patescibacteria group bacterium]|nr:DNA polymerase III subunit beta [Patescibacteria group bacterium]
MKVVILRNNLKESLDIVGRSIGANNNLPILKDVLIDVEENQIKLITTNLESAAIFSISGKVIEKGKIAVPFGVFNDLISNLKSERLDLEKKQKKLEIKTDNYQASINSDSAEEFPVIPQVKTEEYIELNSLIFKESLEQLIISVAEQSIRPELETILFSSKEDVLKMVATNGFRLSEKTFSSSDYKSNLKSELKVLIPLKTARNLISALKTDEPLKIYFDNNQVAFKTKQLNLISRIIEGSYPDYEAIISKSFTTEIILNRQEMIQALRVSGIFSDQSNEVKLKISKEKKNIEIISDNQIIGENNYFIASKTKGDSLEISFNWQYFIDGLKAIKSGEEVSLGLNGNSKPALIKSISDNSFIYLLMPILK